MSQTYSTPRLLHAGDDLDKFDSGEPALDEWLRRQALANNASGASRTFVTTRNDQVVGYYALTSGSVQRSTVSDTVGRRQPESVPIILLGRLAVDRTEQGVGLGGHLLRDAITRSVRAADSVGVRALLVHALHSQARDFYLKYDFEPSPTDDLHLFLLMKDARALVGD